MKKFIILLMVVQVILFIIGITQLIEGSLYFGLFNTIINPIAFMINIDTLKYYNNE